MAKSLKSKVKAGPRKAAPALDPRPTVHAVLISGEHTLLRAFLRAWLSRFSHLQVVAEAANVKEALRLVKKHLPALVLMDFDTLQNASMQFLSKMRRIFPGLKVIIYFAYSNDEIAIKVIRAGADGFVLKSAASEDMEKAIKMVMSGGTYLSPGFLKSFATAVPGSDVVDKDGRALGHRLTRVFKLTALGLSAKAVGMELKLSVAAVNQSRTTLMNRMGLDNTQSLVTHAIEHGLLPA